MTLPFKLRYLFITLYQLKKGRNKPELRRFFRFERQINLKTWQRHDQIHKWAEKCVGNNIRFLEESFSLQTSDPVVLKGHRLNKKARAHFYNKLSHYKELKILIHIPPFHISPGYFSLFKNLQQALNFLGIKTELLSWDDPVETVFDKFKPSVFLSSDHPWSLDKINWDFILKFKTSNYLKVGLDASLEEYGNSPIKERLSWAKENGIDFYYSFKTPEYIKSRKEYKPFFEEGFKIISVEFGANILQYYPIPGIERDLNFVFLASSNIDKRARYLQYLPEIFKSHPGYIDGPGWCMIKKNSLNQNIERFIYARAKVGLNLHINNQIEWASELNERTYMLAACGVPQLVDKARLLPLRFRKESMFIADSHREYKELFYYILNNRDISEKAALSALDDVYGKHTNFHRAENFVQELESQILENTI